MKKSIIFLAFFLMFGNCEVSAQTWYTANQATIAWDASTILENGDGIPAEDTIKYNVYLSDGSGERTLFIETDVTQVTITFNTEGKYFVGVSALRYDKDQVLLNESEISWSNIEPAEKFGFVYWHTIKAPAGLRKP